MGANPTTSFMNTKEIGDIAELNVLTKLTEVGFSMSQPHGENTRYDFIGDFKGRLIKIQVKNGKFADGKIEAKLSSTRYNSSGSSSEYYGDEIDVFVIYCPHTEDIYWLPKSDAPKSQVNLRIEEAECETSAMRWAEDYKICDFRMD